MSAVIKAITPFLDKQLLLDSLEDAMLEAEEKFNINKNSWKEL